MNIIRTAWNAYFSTRSVVMTNPERPENAKSHPEQLLIVQNNLACTYQTLGRHEQALRLKQEVYSGRLKLKGEHDKYTLEVANNYATSLATLKRYEEAKALLRKTIPVARRVFGKNDALTLTMRSLYVQTLCRDPNATLDDLREALTTLEDMERIARRVFGGAHPVTKGVELDLRNARAALRAREETQPPRDV